MISADPRIACRDRDSKATLTVCRDTFENDLWYIDLQAKLESCLSLRSAASGVTVRYASIRLMSSLDTRLRYDMFLYVHEGVRDDCTDAAY